VNFQDTLSTFQAVGYFPVEVLPLPVGPRQLGQSSAKTRGTVGKTKTATRQSADEHFRCFIAYPSVVHANSKDISASGLLPGTP
jgi:hypothetical protein